MYRNVTTYDPTHPLASKRGAVIVSRVVLYDALGPGDHPCHWCGKTVHWTVQTPVTVDGLQVDHIDNNPANNDRTNLVPSCGRCNARRRAGTVRPDEPHILRPTGLRARTEIRVCTFCEKKFQFVPADKRANAGQFCTQSCAVKHRALYNPRTVPATHRSNSRVKDGELFISRPDGGRTRAKQAVCEGCHTEFLAPLGAATRFCSKSCASRASKLGKPRSKKADIGSS